MHGYKNFVRIYKKARLQNIGDYVIYNPQALSSTLTSLGHHSSGPLGYKFCRPLRLKCNYYVRIRMTSFSKTLLERENYSKVDVRSK